MNGPGEFSNDVGETALKVRGFAIAQRALILRLLNETGREHRLNADVEAIHTLCEAINEQIEVLERLATGEGVAA